MKFFFGFLAFIAAIVVVILLITNIFRSSNGDNNNLITTTYDLSSPEAKDSIVRYTVAGPVVADENYRQIRITISKNSRTIEVLKGYKNNVEKTVTLTNTEESYKAFLGALSAANFANKRDGVSTKPESTCVTGNKYYYELNLVADRKIDSWTTSCSYNYGTYAGNVEGTALVFRNQIPAYYEITNGVNLYSL